MGRASDGKVVGTPGLPEYGNPRTSAIKHDIERTRDEMEDTVNAIETRLSPARIKEQISSVKEHAVGQFRDAKTQVTEDIKSGIDDAKDKLFHGIDDAKTKVRSEIVGARAAMREATVGKVEHMVERAGNQVRTTGTTVMDTVKTNPIPAALVGFGLAWLLVGARKQASSQRRFDGGRRRSSTDFRTQRVYGSSYGAYEDDRNRVRTDSYGGGYAAYDQDDEDDMRDTRENRPLDEIGSTARDFAHRATETVEGATASVRRAADDIAVGARDKIGGARDAAGRFAHDARERAVHFVDEGRTQFVRAERGVEHLFQDNPLAIGAVAFAVGAAVGLALPTTPLEDRMFGEAKDRLLHTAEGAARDALKAAEGKATDVLHGTKDQAQAGAPRI